MTTQPRPRRRVSRGTRAAIGVARGGLRVQKVRAAAGLPSTVKLHHLRHTLSTLLDECGATETLKAGILGHAKATQTQKYTHARLAAMRGVLQAVEDRLLSAAEQKEAMG